MRAHMGVFNPYLYIHTHIHIGVDIRLLHPRRMGVKVEKEEKLIIT